MERRFALIEPVLDADYRREVRDAPGHDGALAEAWRDDLPSHSDGEGPTIEVLLPASSVSSVVDIFTRRYRDM
jgi:hypothetical protein